jgi:hypothetical protein
MTDLVPALLIILIPAVVMLVCRHFNTRPDVDSPEAGDG